MWLYALRRLAIALPTIAGVVLIVFVLFRLLPGDAAELALGAHADPAALADLRHTLGLDRPLLPDPAGGLAGLGDCQLAGHLRGLAVGDLGISWQTRQPVAELILQGIVPSLSLAVPIFLGHQIAGLGLAILAALRRGSAWDTGLTVLAVVSGHVPMVALVACGQWLLAFHLGLFPIHGWSGPGDIILPVLLGIAAGIGGHVRFYRTLLVEESQREYVRCARAKGVDGADLLIAHVLPNVLVPITTRLAMEIPHLILGSLLLERFFGVPGLGGLLVDAIAARDMPVLCAMTTLGAVLFIAGNLAGDLACHRLQRRMGTA